MLAALEETGRIRRGYFVEGLGAAQFASAGAVDRVRAFAAPARTTTGGPGGLVLAAADPANPYGAALPWPAADGRATRSEPARSSAVRRNAAAEHPGSTARPWTGTDRPGGRAR